MTDQYVCAGCGAVENELWQTSVNLTPDMLMVEHEVFMRDLCIEADVAFDWCTVECFMRWLFRQCVHSGAQPRITG